MSSIRRLLDGIFLDTSGRLQEKSFVGGHLVEDHAGDGGLAAPIQVRTVFMIGLQSLDTIPTKSHQEKTGFRILRLGCRHLTRLRLSRLSGRLHVQEQR